MSNALSRLTRRRTRNLGSHLFLILICLIMLFPLYWMGVTALKSLNEALQSPPTLWPQEWHFENFATVLAGAPFGRYLFNTLFTSLVSAIGNVITGALAGYALARKEFPARRTLLVLVLATMMVPVESTFIPNFVIVRELGWYDSYTALIVPWLTTAFSIFLFRQAFASVPESVFEAGKLDGCSDFRMFRSVALPMARATSITVFLISFVWGWNAFLWPLLVTANPDLLVIQLGLTSFQTDGGVYVNLLMAATAISIIPIALLFVFTQRFIINGISEGAIR